MAANYEKLAASIVEALGGKSNIKSVTHCATRLRFNLVSKALADKKTLEAIDGVLGTQVGAGTYQVLIGTNVAEVYDTLIEKYDITGAGEVDADEEDTKPEKIGLVDRFTRMMSTVFSPYIPIFATAGIVGGIIALLANAGVVSPDSVTYQAFYAISYSLIYFFPILLAFTAAKHFKCNQYVAAVLGASLMYPDLANMLETGKSIYMFHIKFTAFNFASSFIPILLAVFCMSYLEKWLKRVLPQAAQFILVPLVCLAVLVPLTIMVFGPVGGMLGNGIVLAYNALFHFRILGDIVFGAFFIIVILLGLHWAVLPIQLAALAQQGQEYGLASGGMGNYALLGVCLAVLLISKDKEQKATAGSAAFVNVLSGITEPGLYGIVLKNKRYLLSLILGGASGGLICGIFDVAATKFAFSGILAFGAWLQTINFVWYCVAIATSIAVGFILTVVLDKGMARKKG